MHSWKEKHRRGEFSEEEMSKKNRWYRGQWPEEDDNEEGDSSEEGGHTHTRSIAGSNLEPSEEL